MEMVAGGRDGKVTCFSGGKNASGSSIKLTADFIADPTNGGVPLTVQFTDLSTAENTTITTWEWDFDNDGIIDSTDQHPNWIYTEEGNYTVSLTISDGTRFDTEIKEDYIIAVPTSLEIRPISGGLFTVKTNIRNTGEAPLSEVEWQISLDGGIVILGGESTGTIPSIGVGETIDITSKVILGLGKTTITVYAESAEGISAQRTKSATLLLLYIHIPPGGGI